MAGYYFDNKSVKKFRSNSDPGTGQTIDAYEWQLNGVIIGASIDTVTIDTSTIPLGSNTLSHRIKNKCGNWSTATNMILNIIDSTRLKMNITTGSTVIRTGTLYTDVVHNLNIANKVFPIPLSIKGAAAQCYISNNTNNGFRLNIRNTQTSDCPFDYVIIQTI
jgi:hypothetical protein